MMMVMIMRMLPIMVMTMVMMMMKTMMTIMMKTMMMMMMARVSVGHQEVSCQRQRLASPLSQENR